MPLLATYRMTDKQLWSVLGSSINALDSSHPSWDFNSLGRRGNCTKARECIAELRRRAANPHLELMI